MANKLVWVDIPAVNLDRAIRFYSAVLGGVVEKQEYPDIVIGTLPGKDGEASGCLPLRQDGEALRRGDRPQPGDEKLAPNHQHGDPGQHHPSLD